VPYSVIAILVLLANIILRTAVAFAWEQPNGGNIPSPNDCAPVYDGTIAHQGQLVDYHAGATISCYTPGNTAPYGPTAVRGGTVADGTQCGIFEDVPVRLQDLSTSILATWTAPDGRSGSDRIDPGTEPGSSPAAGVSGYDLYVRYGRRGTYQNGQCQGDGPWMDVCVPFQWPSPQRVPCFIREPHLITPATSPPPSITPYVRRVVGDLVTQPGSIHSLPAEKGLVNLPTCFWLEGLAVPQERDSTLVLPGAPDASGRRIYYTFLIRVFFANVAWDFGDPFGNGQTVPDPACGQRPQLTAHSYPMISEKASPDGRYHVRATENYQVTVDLYWDDSYGAHRRPVDPGIPLPVTVTTPVYDQYVGQVEAIPVGS
jgi:hypothetical protein